MRPPIQERDPGDENDHDVERDNVTNWRFEKLVRAGYPIDVAEMLADRSDVDHSLACALLRDGATIHQALRIVT